MRDNVICSAFYTLVAFVGDCISLYPQSTAAKGSPCPGQVVYLPAFNFHPPSLDIFYPRDSFLPLTIRCINLHFLWVESIITTWFPAPSCSSLLSLHSSFCPFRIPIMGWVEQLEWSQLSCLEFSCNDIILSSVLVVAYLFLYSLFSLFFSPRIMNNADEETWLQIDFVSYTGLYSNRAHRW